MTVDAPSMLCVSIRVLGSDPVFHGCGDGGVPEWPPSPLRVFQALVAAAASRWPTSEFKVIAAPVLEQLAGRVPSTIVAPESRPGVPFRIAVPNNDLDVLALSWSKGRLPNKQPAELKTMKTVWPTRLLVADDEPATIYYLYPLANVDGLDVSIVQWIARSVTHLGWGVDMVAADASVLSENEARLLRGVRWRMDPARGDRALRVPVSGRTETSSTLEDLMVRHRAFLSRVGPDTFCDVPPLIAFRSIGYRPPTDQQRREFVAFSLLKVDVTGPRVFDTVTRTREVAGMVRNAVARLAENNPFWADRPSNQFIHGKTPDGSLPASGADSPNRFFYLPLPTIAKYSDKGRRVEQVGAIRRLLIAAPAECGEELAWVRRALSGEELRDESGNAQAVLTILPRSDRVLRDYLDTAHCWSTVTPVLLPRHRGYSPAEAEEELRRAFVHAGFAPDLVERLELDWRRAGFRAGVSLASKYLPPENLANKPRYHVCVRFPHAVPGPIAVGSGRFRGFGLFART